MDSRRVPEAPPAAATTDESIRPPRVPSPLGRRVLLFEFIILAEFWVAPLFLGITNFAGTWSEIGMVLFFPFVGSLLVFVLWPLRFHLRRALVSRGRRLLFHGVWVGSFVLSLFVTNVLQFVDGTAIGAVVLGQSTVYTPLGAWPSLTVYIPSIQLWATFNIEAPTILLLLSILSASAIVLSPARRSESCPAPSGRSAGWRSRFASLGVLTPLGLITGCAGCSPAYIALLALVAPGAAMGAYAAIPLVPWIGFAGLLYLVGFWVAVRLLERRTGDTPVGTPLSRHHPVRAEGAVP